MAGHRALAEVITEHDLHPGELAATIIGLLQAADDRERNSDNPQRLRVFGEKINELLRHTRVSTQRIAGHAGSEDGLASEALAAVDRIVSNANGAPMLNAT